MLKLFISAFFLLTLISPAQAKDMPAPMDHSKMMMSAAPDDPFAQSRMDMHEAMEVKPSGSIDADFVANMIPHHEGAVAMAKIELEKGTDPELKKLATDIIAAQEKEIAFMKKWQAAH